MKNQFWVMAAVASLIGSMGVVMAVQAATTVSPPDVCYDTVGNTRYVGPGEPCKSNETRSKGIPQTTSDPADDPQAQLQKQMADMQAQFQKQIGDLTAKVSALQAQVDSSKNASDPEYPESTNRHDAKTGKVIDDPRNLKPVESDPSRPDNQVHSMPGQNNPGTLGGSKTAGNSGTPTRVTVPFQVVDTSGNVVLDVQAGGGSDSFRGVKIFSGNHSYTQIGTTSGHGYANVGIHKPGQENASIIMGIDNADNTSAIDIYNSGESLVTRLAETTGGHGELQLSNTAKQPVVIIGSNPTNGEGHAIFTDAGGKPLAEIGAAGAHGDVLLGDGSKAVAVWEMTLTGFH